MKAINLNRLAYFAAVVDTRSFTRAADRLGMTKAVVSQHVARLEAELETSLLVRTTRRVLPTEAGRTLFARCSAILREAQDAVDELAQAKAVPKGVLRIAAPNDYGALTVAPLAASFARRFPTCSVNLILSDGRTDLIAEQVDLSIRVGWLDDSGLQSRRIGTFRQVLVASTRLAKSLLVREPGDLAALPLIANTALREPLRWHFSRPGFPRRTITMQQALSINTSPAVLAATLADGGLAVLPDFQVTAYLRTGRLVTVLPEWSLPSGGIYAVYPAARFRPPKVTAFVSMLTDELRKSGKKHQEA